MSSDARREYRLEVIVLKEAGTQFTEAKVVDQTTSVAPTDGFSTLTAVENRRYHVRTRLAGMGSLSEQFEYQYYPSCGTDEELSPTLSLVIHPPSDQGHPFVGFSQAECQPE